MFYTPDTHVVLRDGSTLRIRPLASDDHRWLGTIETIVSANRDAAFMRLLPSTAAHVRRVVDAPPDEAYAIVGELGGRPCAVATQRRLPVDALLRLSALVGLSPEIAELDINPLSVLPEGVRALDARVRIEPPRARPLSRRVEY